MTAPRSSSLRALRALSQQSVAPSSRRCLHITGVQSAQPANSGEKTLSNHDVLQSRAFSIAMRRINGSAFPDSSSSRQFNTSRATKALNDSSTVDFVFMPNMADLDAAPLQHGIQVPVLPEHPSIQGRQTPTTPPMKPQIYTVSGTGADVPASAMSEVVDNHAIDLDPFSLTEAVGRSRVGEEIQRRSNDSSEPGVIRELWAGFLDDVMGPKESMQRK
ncbi:unnamed protein product [Penicillium nalgiovense]|uniref:Uncharacterized protein n=1 Tax=Penicillium nalgiovense TaxID=60175 RepID=A0A1V6YX36_PENNA|nr:hypothetical protein PENNAL_c0008G07207 [Penicillium nalgiovense]CAG7944575.1 unnamed protein product [Penicillium nalgiovense]CAG7954535.1 unnamed protein product [Penicillium nalgiovense]CAG7961688.1 unnamed protein product [Penicillium nalgiovense]CAG7963095.1 unnamed protein product [Penicillium nalgiovense]